MNEPYLIHITGGPGGKADLRLKAMSVETRGSMAPFRQGTPVAGVTANFRNAYTISEAYEADPSEWGPEEELVDLGEVPADGTASALKSDSRGPEVTDVSHVKPGDVVSFVRDGGEAASEGVLVTKVFVDKDGDLGIEGVSNAEHRGPWFRYQGGHHTLDRPRGEHVDSSELRVGDCFDAIYARGGRVTTRHSDLVVTREARSGVVLAASASNPRFRLAMGAWDFYRTAKREEIELVGDLHCTDFTAHEHPHILVTSFEGHDLDEGIWAKPAYDGSLSWRTLEALPDGGGTLLVEEEFSCVPLTGEGE